VPRSRLMLEGVEVEVKLLEEIRAFPNRVRRKLEAEFGIDSAESFKPPGRTAARARRTASRIRPGIGCRSPTTCSRSCGTREGGNQDAVSIDSNPLLRILRKLVAYRFLSLRNPDGPQCPCTEFT